MRKDNLKLKAYIEEYGYSFVLEAIEKAIDERTASELRRGVAKKTIDKAYGEARIIRKAQEMGVRLLND